MQAARLVLWLCVASLLVGLVEPFLIAMVAVGAGAAVATVIMDYVVGKFGGISNNDDERCDDKWINFNSTGLRSDLNNRLFGQHLASPIIFKAVSGFMSSTSSQKPLVLSLHGTTGTGKNFVSKMIVDNIYQKGMRSNFVHLFTATKHFPHASQVAAYKVFLQNYIETNVTKCERSLFIFDEMDKMPPGMIDVIKPYLDYYEHLDRVSYKNAIFLFLSNNGGQEIADTALRFKNNGLLREKIELRDLEEFVSLSAFNNKISGFFQCSVFERSLVDFFVPFLPLERRHVVQCVLAEMKSQNQRPNRKVADELAGDLVKEENAFSSKGCKTVQNKLAFYL